jgi:anaerobic magnesium-protoporphyrin IX monomethyl ester cyclase
VVDVLLIYPYFRPSHDHSVFRFPPLGLGYIASHLRSNNVSVQVVDCTFLDETHVIRKVHELSPSIIGIYSMYTMEENSKWFARLFKPECDLVVTGGPLPSICPERFLQDFDVVVVGEGEQTMLELARSTENGDLSGIPGIVYNENHTRDKKAPPIHSRVLFNRPRQVVADLDSLQFPARDLFDNDSYQRQYKKTFGYSLTSMMSSRGCPFSCDFCSKPVFGDTFRARSPRNVVDEIEEVLSYGYDGVFFQDDCFTLDKKRVTLICDEIIRRGLKLEWECLSRVDVVDSDIMRKMRQAGCRRVFFGIESGNDTVLRTMRKEFTADQAGKAVRLARSEGIRAGAFFILGYPGETDDTIIDTIRFSTSLPLDYLSYTLPYPMPGTGLYEKANHDAGTVPPKAPARHRLIDHDLVFRSPFSERKLKFAIAKATTQFRLRKHLGDPGYSLIGRSFEVLSDLAFRALK